MNIIQKLEKIQDANALEQEMANATTLEDLQQLLKRHGVEVTIEEIESLAVQASEAGDELSAEALDSVAGGASCWKIVGGVLRWIAKNLPKPRLPKLPNKRW